MSEWKVWYSDETTFGVADGTPAQAPVWGVVAITQKMIDPEDNIEKHVRIQGPDYYMWLGDEWVGSDTHGVIERLLNRVSVDSLLSGRWVQRALYLKILKASAAEMML